MTGWRPRKGLGQNFLNDGNAQAKLFRIIMAVQPKRVIEIGPGRGDMAARFLLQGIPVCLIEKDKILHQALSRRFASDERVTLMHTDVRHIQADRFPHKKGDVMFGNLPFVTATAIFRYTMTLPVYDNYFFMFQQEVAERLAALPGDSNYSYISLFRSLYVSCKPVLRLPPDVFWPRPKVHAAVLHLRPLSAPPVPKQDIQPFTAFAKQCFSQKRKTLRRMAGKEPASPALQQLLAKRPHQLTVQQMYRLYKLLA